MDLENRVTPTAPEVIAAFVRYQTAPPPPSGTEQGIMRRGTLRSFNKKVEVRRRPRRGSPIQLVAQGLALQHDRFNPLSAEGLEGLADESLPEFRQTNR